MATRVALVLHSAAKRTLVESLLAYMPLWIVDTDTNRTLLTSLEENLRRGSEPDWCITFVVQDVDSRLTNAMAIAGTIFEHHTTAAELHVYGLNYEELTVLTENLPNMKLKGYEYPIDIGEFKFVE